MNAPAHELGNTFAYLASRDAEELRLKTALVLQLSRLIKSRGLSQIEAITLTGAKQSDLHDILQGNAGGFSVERLMKMLTLLAQDVEIVVKPHRRAGEPGRISFRRSPV
jgi:predicted XRE-type DNA-binding protein